MRARLKLALAVAIFFAVKFLGAQVSPPEVIDSLSARWDKVHDCSCTMETFTYADKKSEHQILDYWFVRPKWIYMRVIGGRGKGSRVLYNPETNKVRVRAGGIFGAIPLTFSPEDKKVQSIRGHKIYNNHIGYMIFRWKYYLKNCRTTITDSDSVIVLEAVGADTSMFHGAYREILAVDKKSFFPVYFEQYDITGNLIHRVIMSDIKINQDISPQDLEKKFNG